jgi:23S rRNA (guanosine2251-2'-O)-methyltransferase
MKIDNSDIIYGRNPIFEALNSGMTVVKVFLQNNIRGEMEVEFRRKCKELEVPLSKVPPEKLRSLVGNVNHQGVVAFISPVKFYQLQDIISQSFETGENPFILVLDGVNDMRNIAAISRTALVFGVHAMVITAKNSGRINADVVKSSSGAILQIPVCREKSLHAISEILISNGIPMIAADLSGKEYLHSLQIDGAKAVIMGSEHEGVQKEILQKCEHIVKIIQANDFDSLNVSVATGIFLYQLTKKT